MKNTIKAPLRSIIPRKFRPKLRAQYDFIREHYGFKYKCPLCHSNLRHFLPHGLKQAALKGKHVVGGGYRLNALCPVCGSLDRERLLYLYLLNKTNIFDKTTNLLHVAPEEQLEATFHKQANLDYLTADLYSEKSMVNMDLCDIQFADNSFDAIICNHVLEHIVDDRRALSELYRVLKPGGWVILQVPISLSLEATYEDCSVTTTSAREQAFGQADHVRIYARDYKDRLEQSGFSVEVFQWSTESRDFGGEKNRFGLNKDESVYRAIRPR